MMRAASGGSRKYRPAIETLEERTPLANSPPVLTDPPDQSFPASQESIAVTLQATDPDDGTVLTFTAEANTEEHYLDQTIDFSFFRDYFQNSEGLDEKWLLGDGGQNWYYILPSGELWLWHGGGVGNATLIASLDVEVYETPALLHDAPAGTGEATLQVDSGILTITPDPEFTGLLTIDVTVSDGELSDSQQFMVTVTGNRPPALVDPGPQSLLATLGSLELNLAASDPDDDDVTFSAVVHSSEYALDQEFDFSFTGDYSLNFGGLQEKWIVAGDSSWYYLLPDGSLWKWLGGGTGNAERVARFSTATYDDPARLHDAEMGDGPAVAEISIEDVLKLTPASDFRGTLAVDITASDGELSDTKRVLVTVTGNEPPILTEVGSLRFPVTLGSLQTTLAATDIDGDTLTFTATLHSAEYQLDQTVGLNFTGDYSLNHGGLQEKWLLADDNSTWYYITPDGQLWRWLGGSTRNAALVTALDPDTYEDPSRLYDAEPGTAPAVIALNGAQLTIDPEDGFIGLFGMEVIVSDGTDTDSELVLVEVTPPPNNPPVLAQPPNQSLQTNRDTLNVVLTARDLDNEPLTYSAQMHTAEYYFDQTLQLEFTGDYSFNSAGLNEKWLQGSDETWYYITPDGLLWEWLGGALTNRLPLGSVSTAAYDTPELLYDAQPGGAAGVVAVSGARLTINPDAEFVGVLGVEASVTDGEDTDTKLFFVRVTPENVLGLEERVAGKSYNDWTRAWFQWLVGDTVEPATAFPFDFPLTDPIGTDATDNQNDGSVFFVGGVFGSSATRTFTVPASKHLFIGLGVSFWTNSPGDDPNRGIAATGQTINAVNELSLTIDGTDIAPSTLFSLRAGRQNFAAAFAENNWFDLATGGFFPAGSTSGHSIDGYWAMIPPLAPGDHTIQFRSVASGMYHAENGFTAEQIAGSTDLTIAFSQEITLNILVPDDAGAGVVVPLDVLEQPQSNRSGSRPLVSLPAAAEWEQNWVNQNGTPWQRNARQASLDEIFSRWHPEEDEWWMALLEVQDSPQVSGWYQPQ